MQYCWHTWTEKITHCLPKIHIYQHILNYLLNLAKTHCPYISCQLIFPSSENQSSDPARIGPHAPTHRLSLTPRICSLLLQVSVPTFPHCLLILKAQFKLHYFHKIFLHYSRVKFSSTLIHQLALLCSLSLIVFFQIWFKVPMRF